MVKKQSTEAGPIMLPRIHLETIEIPLIGDTRLITNAWTEEAKQAIEDKITKKPVTAKLARNPTAEYEGSKYRLPDGSLGLPAGAFKKAAVDACKLVDGFPMTEAKIMFHVLGDLVAIEGEVEPKRDMIPGNSPGGGWTPVYRATFPIWRCKIHVRYYANKLSAEQVVNIFNLAGLCGVGCWRASAPKGKSGSFGMFHVATN